MAAFSTLESCETRAYAKRADGTWVNAHAARQVDNTLCVRVQRFMTTALTQGGWAELTDDGTT